MSNAWRGKNDEEKGRNVNILSEVSLSQNHLARLLERNNLSLKFLEDLGMPEVGIHPPILWTWWLVWCGDARYNGWVGYPVTNLIMFWTGEGGWHLIHYLSLTHPDNGMRQPLLQNTSEHEPVIICFISPRSIYYIRYFPPVKLVD